MKKFLLTILVTIVCSVCFAQTEQSEHMKFKGVPMTGTLQSFTNQLKLKGYTPISINNGVSLLAGEFAGYKGCTIGAIADKSGMICKVFVIFPEMDKWGELEQCYSNYKSMLTEKYGEPSMSEEYFSKGYDKDASDKMYGVKFDKYKYHSDFTTDKGDIKIEISHEGVSSCFVMISYYDGANQAKLRKQIMDDL